MNKRERAEYEFHQKIHESMLDAIIITLTDEQKSALVLRWRVQQAEMALKEAEADLQWHIERLEELGQVDLPANSNPTLASSLSCRILQTMRYDDKHKKMIYGG